MSRKTKNPLTILFLGDVFGKIGRKCVAKVLPELREEYRPDLVIANAENLAHGKGVTKQTLQELLDAGVNFCTGGNHMFNKDEVNTLLSQSSTPLIRPANYPSGTRGDGWRVIEVGTRKVLIVNLLGRVFMKNLVDDPFASFDAILAKQDVRSLAAIIVDFHGEITGEKNAFGWHVDGRASAVLGTHTHIPTADPWVLPKGTAFVTDVGMCGGRDTVIGILPTEALKLYTTSAMGKADPPEAGHCRFNSVLVEIDPATRLATNIERLDREVVIP